MNGKVQTSNARLVRHGLTQKKGVDYEETFFLVFMLKSIWILLSIVVALDYEIRQIDMKKEFLNGYINYTIYMDR